MVVKHQHQVGNALHQHLGAGGRAGLDLGGGQRGDEGFLPQYLRRMADATVDGAFKEGAHRVQVQHVSQGGVQQAQALLPLHLGGQVGRIGGKGHPLQKRMDGGAALGAGHAAFLQEGRALQRSLARGVGHVADADLDRHVLQSLVRAVPGKVFLKGGLQRRVQRGGRRGFGFGQRVRRVQHPDGQRRGAVPLAGQKVGLCPQRAAVRMAQRGGQQPARPALEILQGFGAGHAGVGIQGRGLEGAGGILQRQGDEQRVLRAGQGHI